MLKDKFSAARDYINAKTNTMVDKADTGIAGLHSLISTIPMSSREKFARNVFIALALMNFGLCAYTTDVTLSETLPTKEQIAAQQYKPEDRITTARVEVGTMAPLMLFTGFIAAAVAIPTHKKYTELVKTEQAEKSDPAPKV